MKRFVMALGFLSAALLFLSPVFTEDDDAVDAAAKSAFKKLEDAWKVKNVDAIAAFFPAEDAGKVKLCLDGKEGDHSRKQAISLLQEYFKKVEVVKLELKDGKYKGGAVAPYGLYKYEYRPAGSQEVSAASLKTSLVKSGDGKWLVKRIGVSQ
jgi:hypothetical protein